MTTSMGMAVHLAVASGVIGGALLLSFFPHDMSRMRSGIELSQFLRINLPTFTRADTDMVLVL